jgi:hypothetical protein
MLFRPWPADRFSTRLRTLTRVAWVLLWLLACAQPALGRAEASPPLRPTAPFPHVRSVERDLLCLLARGSRESATFRRIVDEIERSDVIVYIQTVPVLPPPVRAWLQFGSAAGGHRYLRISVAGPYDALTLIALIGHELHHVTEVTRAPDVVDAGTLGILYRRIGHASQNGLETQAARDVGLTVFDELVSNREPSGQPSAAPSRAPSRDPQR